ncbi:MarR family winged helix-turn-helix transcriptional regulator [Frondihabitans sucicola]|nr:MarR family winged helix-turn-helix transcriptional regulator [Frondihabitans sucicola]
MESGRQQRMGVVYTQMETISRRAVARNRRASAPLTVVQHTLLTFIAATRDCRAIDIAHSMRLNRSTVSRQVGDLQELGLVEIATAPVPGTSRGQILVLSPRGRELLESSTRANQRELERRLADWSDDEIDRLARGLQRFNAVDDA